MEQGYCCWCGRATVVAARATVVPARATVVGGAGLLLLVYRQGRRRPPVGVQGATLPVGVRGRSPLKLLNKNKT